MQEHILKILEPRQYTPGLSNKRRHGRIRCEDVECTLGSVLNVSASGLLVRTGLRAPKAGSVIALQVRTFDGGFDVQAQVAWSKMDGLLNRQIGLEFIDLPPDGQRVLLNVVRGAARG
jgi:hypothetical protein